MFWTVEELEVRTSTIRQYAWQSQHANNSTESTEQANTISLHLQLRCAIRFHVVAECIGCWQRRFQG
jgi:hypothetical protein